MQLPEVNAAAVALLVSPVYRLGICARTFLYVVGFCCLLKPSFMSRFFHFSDSYPTKSFSPSWKKLNMTHLF